MSRVEIPAQLSTDDNHQWALDGKLLPFQRNRLANWNYVCPCGHEWIHALRLAPARCLPYLHDAEHTYFPSKSLVVEVVQHLSATWSPWMINWYKWRLLTPRLPCPWQLKGYSSKSAMGLPFDQSAIWRWLPESWAYCRGFVGDISRVIWGKLKEGMRTTYI